MARRQGVVDLYPFDKEEYKKGIQQAITEVMKTKRNLQEAVNDIIDEVPNLPEIALDNLHREIERQTTIELMLRGLASLL